MNRLKLLVESRTELSKEFTKIHKLVFLGDIDSLSLLPKESFGSQYRTKNLLTPLHCALLAKNEQVVSLLVNGLDDEALLEKDDKGLTPLHYACMLGLSESFEMMLKRCKNRSDFDINAVDEELPYSFASLAVAVNCPKIFSILCQNGAKIHGAGDECSAADLLCVAVKDRDPLKISIAQYILTAYNIVSLVTDHLSPQASFALMLCSALATAAFEKGGLRGQMLYWGGEAFSLVTRMGLAQIPLVKAVVDIYRTASVVRPCFDAIGRSFRNMKYETAKAFRCLAVNTAIIGSSVYRIRDSMRHAFNFATKIPSYIQSVFSVSSGDQQLESERNSVEFWRNMLKTEREAAERLLSTCKSDLIKVKSELSDVKKDLSDVKKDSISNISSWDECENNLDFKASSLMECHNEKRLQGDLLSECERKLSSAEKEENRSYFSRFTDLFFRSKKDDIENRATVNQQLEVEKNKVESLSNQLKVEQEAREAAERLLSTCKSDLSNVKRDLNFQVSSLDECENNLASKTSSLSECERKLSSAEKEENRSYFSRFTDLFSWSKKDGIKNKGTDAVAASKGSSQPLSERKIIFGSTFIPGNEYRDDLSHLVNGNHKEYAERWGMVHRVVDKNLLENQCLVNGKLKECSPYWNKIKVLKDWLDDKSGASKAKEEWYVLADDDMVVTNLTIDPYRAIDELRDGQDTSVIVAQDVVPYAGSPVDSVNTGLLFVRKDQSSLSLINQIWERRNQRVRNAPSYCPTLGVCGKQHTLHEQQALSDLIKEQPGLLDHKVSSVPARDRFSSSRKHLALNTFERSGCFIRQTPGWESNEQFSYTEDERYPDGKWRSGDWMGQTAGVPIYGWYCEDKRNGKSPGRLREDKIRNMLKQVIK